MTIEKLKIVCARKKTYMNRTRKFMIPIMRRLDESIREILTNHMRFIGVFVEDLTRKIPHDYCFVLVCDADSYKSDPEMYDRHYELLKQFSEDTYKKDNLDFFAIKVPEEYKGTYLRFLEGRYSQLFTKHDIKELFPDLKDPKSARRSKLNKNARQIMQKDEEYRKVFSDLINSSSTHPEVSIILPEDAELDYIPDPLHEVIFSDAKEAELVSERILRKNR